MGLNHYYNDDYRHLAKSVRTSHYIINQAHRTTQRNKLSKEVAARGR